MRVRDYWLETLSVCATAVMLAVVYSVLTAYAAGPVAITRHASVAAPAPQPWQRLAASTLW